MYSFENLKIKFDRLVFLVNFVHKLFQFTFRVNLYQGNVVSVTEEHDGLFFLENICIFSSADVNIIACEGLEMVP